ncbi:MAG TPA: MATE family efflux transporter [Chthoniobacterales bacterium]|jgi:MATE family multidrug resistance protein
MMAGQLSQMLMGVADTVMVARVGVLPLAACSFASVLVSILFILGLGFQIPVSILGSQANGRGDAAESGQILRHGLFIAASMGFLVACLVTSISFYLDYFGQEPEVVALAQPFLQIVGWSLLPAMIEQCLKQFSEAQHRPWLPMIIMLSATGLNVFLNWVLIYGNLGAPALGIVGAGWATLAARCLSLTVMLACVLRGKFFQPLLPSVWFAKLDRARLLMMAKLGAPLSLSLLLDVGAFGLAAVMMGWISAKSLASHQIAINCAATTFMIPLGLSFATRVRIGHVVGSGENHRLRMIGFSSMAMAVMAMGMFALVFLFFGNTVAAWFVKEQDVVLMAAALLSIAGVFQICDGLQVIAGGCLNGLSDVRVPTLAAFVGYWVIALPLAYYLAFVRGWAGPGIWWALALGLALAAIFAISRFCWLTRRMAPAV